MIIHDSPDASVRARAEFLLDLKKKPGKIRIPNTAHSLTPYEWAVRELCQEDPWFLIRFALGFHHFDEELHGKTLLSFYFQPREARDKIIIIPRDHCKTTMSIVVGIQRFLREPDIAIFYASATEALARSVAGEMADHMVKNEVLQASFPDILPQSPKDCKKWGLKGYELPNRRPRKEESIYVCSLNTTLTGRHPDLIVIDDIIGAENNNEKGWLEAADFIKTCFPILPPHGFFEILATRWSDKDPYGPIIAGDMPGKQGKFDALVMPCWKDGKTDEEPIWPRRCRWTSERPSGYSTEMLLNTKKAIGALFNSQYLNDPMPESDQALQVKNVQVYPKAEMPKFGKCVKVVCEVTGGGLPIYNIIEDEAVRIGLPVPIEQAPNSKTDKHDRILSVLEAPIRLGRLWVQDWMMGPSEETLEYELKRLGVAKHDDIADCLATLIHASGGACPPPDQPADLYIGVDLAWSDKKSSDFTVVMALAVTPDDQLYILDYDRFREKSPTVIANRVIEFYRRWDSVHIAQSSRPRTSLAKTYC